PGERSADRCSTRLRSGWLVARRPPVLPDRLRVLLQRGLRSRPAALRRRQPTPRTPRPGPRAAWPRPPRPSLGKADRAPRRLLALRFPVVRSPVPRRLTALAGPTVRLPVPGLRPPSDPPPGL